MGSLMRAIRILGPRARVELSEYTGISPATVTKLVASLAEANILTERVDPNAVRVTGRPRVPVDFASGARVVLALHLGAESATAAAINLRGSVLSERTNSYPAGPADKAVQSAARMLNRLRKTLGPDTVPVGVGISSDGEIDQPNGTLISHPLLDWHQVAVRDLVADLVELPTEYDQTVRGQALGAFASGQGEPTDLVHCAVNGRVQAAFVLDAGIYRGHDGFAGSIEHWPVAGVRGPACRCGQTNCLATVAGDDGVTWLARDRGLIGADDGYPALVEAAEARVRGAVTLLRSRAQWIGRALAVLADLIDPATVMISGSAQQWSSFESEVRAALDATPGRIDSDRLITLPSSTTPVVASAMLFLDRYFADPVHYEPELQRRLSA